MMNTVLKQPCDKSHQIEQLKPREKASFPVRRMDFAFDDVPKYWLAGDAGLTHFMTALSALFPEGEQFFVDSIRAVRKHPKLHSNKRMQAEISAFIGQEAMHSKEHEAFNASARSHGFDIDKLERWTRKVINVKNYLPLFTRREKLDLSITCALEHYTATIAEQLLKREDVHEMMSSDRTMLTLWLWHAIEENEHKAVAYDVFETLYGSDTSAYALRCFSMAVATVLLFVTQSYFTMYLMRQDKKLRLKNLKYTINFMYGKRGFFTQIFPKLADYYRRDFHPNGHDTVALLEKWKAELNFNSN